MRVRLSVRVRVRDCARTCDRTWPCRYVTPRVSRCVCVYSVVEMLAYIMRVRPRDARLYFENGCEWIIVYMQELYTVGFYLKCMV